MGRSRRRDSSIGLCGVATGTGGGPPKWLPEGTKVLPREVYETAVRGLGTLVSPRAATRMVDAALRAANRTPDDISAAAMKRLLLGRIRQELQGVLPKAALDTGLKLIAADVATDGS